MPRPERPLDTQSRPLGEFAEGLRELRRDAGGLTYRTMARKANYSASVLSEAAAGRRLPTLAVTLAYVRACGGDPDAWQARWSALVETAEPEPAREARPPIPAQRSLWSPTVVLQLVTAVAVLMAAVAALVVAFRHETGTVAAPSDDRPRPREAAQTSPSTLTRSRTAEGAPAEGGPSQDMPCSDHTKARACVDVANRLLWVKDVPPADGHHAAVYWAAADGDEVGECHNYLQADGPWVTCGYPELRADSPFAFQVAVVEKETVLEWGPQVTLPST